jgi:hypothetical protein
VASSGFTNDATSGPSVSSGNNTTTGSPVTVYAGDSGTISEQFSVGSAGSYNATLACTGNTTAVSGNSLTVNAADTTIVCTYTNTLIPPPAEEVPVPTLSEWMLMLLATLLLASGWTYARRRG